MVRSCPSRNIPLVIFLFICYFLSVFPAHAGEYPQDFTFKGLYKVNFSGMLVGKIGVDFNQTANGYEATSDIVSSGLLKLFTQHSSHTTVKATGKNFTYGQIDYVTDYQTKKKKKHVDIHYENSAFKSENLVPPENPAKRPPVSLDLKNTSLDPLSSMFMTRAKLREALMAGQNEFTIKTYDGRRLTTINYSIISKKVLRLYGVKVPVVEVEAKRSLTAGFTKSELKDYDPDEPSLTMYFSDNDVLFPVRLELVMYMSTISVDLFKRCAEHESCLLGNDS